jgi:hypothetical protein
MGGGNERAKYDASQKVYEKDQFIILKVQSGKKVGYIAYNTKKEWKDGHTHLDSFDMAKTVISNVIKHKKPKTKNIYLIRSHARLSDDLAYVRYIDELIMAKKSKQKQEYRNRTF